MPYAIVINKTREAVRGAETYSHGTEVLGWYERSDEAKQALELAFVHFLDEFEHRRLPKTKQGMPSGLLRVDWSTHTVEYRFRGIYNIREYTLEETT